MTAQTITIGLAQPIGSVRILNDYVAGDSEDMAESERAISDSELKAFMQAATALTGAAAKLKEFSEKEIKQHNQQIAKLAIEIARKVLMQEVRDGHYKIEAIVQEALKNAPSRDDAVVHLNTADAAVCWKMQENAPEMFANVKIVVDANVKTAECVVETPRGIVESFIETQLQHIAEALAHSQ